MKTQKEQIRELNRKEKQAKKKANKQLQQLTELDCFEGLHKLGILSEQGEQKLKQLRGETQ